MKIEVLNRAHQVSNDTLFFFISLFSMELSVEN